jgi:site-specific DNA-cytosine methylase
MERFQLPCQLHVQHQFSCEKEPFKQSYLARNFDSTLYPDVVKLTETDTPLDVYGRPKKIPTMNGLIAGTSCKNFSMLVSTRRLDIEDKGCSGETFLATVELLFQEQPLISIFENVTGKSASSSGGHELLPDVLHIAFHFLCLTLLPSPLHFPT